MKNWYYPDTSSAVLLVLHGAFICGTHDKVEEGEGDVGGQARVGIYQ